MKLPKVGWIVEVTWIDSGLDVGEREAANKTTLAVSTIYGRVVRFGECAKLRELIGNRGDVRVLVLATDSAGEEDEKASLGFIWWTSVIACNKLVSAK